MEIYVLRHGIAEAARPGQPDVSRALTKDGRDKLTAVLAAARSARVSPSVILTSPYLRALQTAEMAAQALAPGRAPERADALTPASSPQRVWQEIMAHDEEPSVMLVGHEPLLGETISYLVGADRVIVDFKKGALARIDIEEGVRRPAGRLVWLITPKLARAE